MGSPRPRSPGRYVKELESRLEYIRDKQWQWTTNKEGRPYYVGEIEALEWALPILRRARVYEEDAHLLRQGRRVAEEGGEAQP